MDSFKCMLKKAYDNGDSIYYKRTRKEKWRGPGKVIGHDRKVIFIHQDIILIR